MQVRYARAEGPAVLPAMGIALVMGLNHPSSQRANNSYASIARTDLVAHHLQHRRTLRVSPERGHPRGNVPHVSFTAQS